MCHLSVLETCKSKQSLYKADEKLGDNGVIILIKWQLTRNQTESKISNT